MRQNAGVLRRLIARTRPKAYRSSFGRPARAAVVCVSMEQFLVADAATSSRGLSPRDRRRSFARSAACWAQPCPSMSSSPNWTALRYFAEYVRNLSSDEVRQVLGKALPAREISAGVYTDTMSRELGSALDVLTYSLGEFRIEALNRETEPRNAPGVYEFPARVWQAAQEPEPVPGGALQAQPTQRQSLLERLFLYRLRAQMLEQRVAAPATPMESAAVEIGATRMFSQQDVQGAGRPPAQQMGATRAPQWAFLPRVFPEMILSDKSALSATQQTAPARALPQISSLLRWPSSSPLTHCAWCCSYLNNAALERNIQSAAQRIAGGQRRHGTQPGRPAGA